MSVTLVGRICLTCDKLFEVRPIDVARGRGNYCGHSCASTARGGPKPKTEEERFWPKVDKTDGCWLWTASTFKAGYGKFKAGSRRTRNERTVTAHDWAYRQLVGEVPDGRELDHLCRVPLCVRPSHLEPVTHRVNCLRGVSPNAINARKEVCSRGHPFAGENLIQTRTGRKCRACRDMYNSQRYSK